MVSLSKSTHLIKTKWQVHLDAKHNCLINHDGTLWNVSVMPYEASLGVCLWLYGTGLRLYVCRNTPTDYTLSGHFAHSLPRLFLRKSRAISMWMSEWTRLNHNLRWRNSFQSFYSHVCTHGLCGPVLKETFHILHSQIYREQDYLHETNYIWRALFP